MNYDFECIQIIPDISKESSGPSYSVVKLAENLIDLNLKIEYQYNTNWSFFANGLNLVAGSYEKWHNYPVQGLQILAGAKYHFGF